MKYYIVKNELDTSIVGSSFPQVDCHTMHQAHTISSWHLCDPHLPKLRFELQPGAILTDVLSDLTIGSRGFLISSKVKAILEAYHVMRHQYFPATVETKQGIQQYYWLHLCEPDLLRQLDYRESVFYRTEYTFREELIELKSYDHYQELKGIDKDAAFGVDLEKIVLSDKFDRTLDMFTFLPFDGNVYLSETLKNALTMHHVKGFKFEETNKLAYTSPIKT